MTFAEKLMELRRQKGWSQEELGEKLGVTRQTVSKWELGSTTPEMEKLAAISDLFGITTDELIKGKAAENTDVITEKKTRFSGGEYKSEKTWRGMPVVHISVKGCARGVIAIGLAAKGVVAIGLASIGVVSIGLVSLGIIAIGMFAALGVFSTSLISFGIVAVGSFALGVFSLGGMSVGWLAFGGIATGQYAFGGLASGTIVVGGTGNGVIAVGGAMTGEIVLTAPVSADEFRAIVTERLPDTPKFIVDMFAWFAENLEAHDVSIQATREIIL
ncbi:MAG: helix-turn-helix domain-containing protein [Oscillospiraceae bacterium]|nr:helix-turn-helix domain-containing protein [Oscillospiraceae bacterium]